MTKRIFTMGVVIGACCAVAAWAAPPTPQEDEARIEELMLAESTALPAAPAPASPAAPGVEEAATPVIVAVAPTPAASGEDWVVEQQKDDSLTFAELSAHLGGEVSITTTNERTHRGKVIAADANTVTLSVRRRGGAATYTLRREQVSHIDAR